MGNNFCILDFGCKVNQYEGQCIREALVEMGNFLAAPEEAELIIVNGCAVTYKAEAKSISEAKYWQSKGKKVILTGCAGKSLQLTARELDGIEVVPQEEKLNYFGARERVSYLLGHHRAFVKLQDGCSFACSYCYIPKLRGPARLREEKAIREDIRALAKRGYKEVIFTGICLGWGGQDIVGLVKFARQEGIKRIRLSSIEPCFLSDEIVGAIEDGILCPHLHIPFQSGSDTVLKRMGRNYSSEFYLNLVNKVRERVPDVAISTDIMVGFPGETEEEFGETLRFLEMARPMRIHTFPYSRRPGTEAEKMVNQVPDKVKKERVRRVIELGESFFEEYERRMVGKVLDVLVIDKEGEEWVGISGNYLKVRFRSLGELLGEIVEVPIREDVRIEPV